MLSDIEISRNAQIKPIKDIAKTLDIDVENDIDLYGRYKAKINEPCYDRLMKKPETGKLILVTAMSPTKYGEGKTTMSIGLGQALHALGRKTVIALREPSLGPVFGLKGGAAGGGYSQVIPMEDINLHFTGDFHAITSANNLLCAMIDNHIHQGNELGIETSRITFSRCMDMNDRALREVMVGLGKRTNGIPRQDGFRITAASEIMAIFCLAESLGELKEMLGRITVGYTFDDKPIYAKDLKADGAMCALLKEAFQPNFVQTLEGAPVLLHGGPFANIAHGCNSIRATAAALKLSDYTVTEAGFGADLGAEKFLDIKCRKAKFSPDAVVLVATVRAIKLHGNEDLTAGFQNVLAHVENLRKFNVNPILVINKFPSDSKDELDTVKYLCAKYSIPASVSTAFEDGGKGSEDLAKKVIDICESQSNGAKKINFTYENWDSVRDKIGKIAKNIYGASGVIYSEKAESVLNQIRELGYEKMPVCMAKTQYSLSDNPKLLNRPKDFELTVKDMVIQTGAGFIVVLTGDIMIMPGLPKAPNAEIIDVDENGNIINLS
ncbi:MAG: formate--tetrahydrofolate ligase [Oscillospiraceae bacterium]|nr:formate--tetrahydrofolate ligase [Oscillospiraceae bacterium]